MTTRSPSSRKRGSSEKCECTSDPSDLAATSMRTESRVRPRLSGGDGASSSGGSEKDSGCSSGRRARAPDASSRAGAASGAHVSAPAASTSRGAVAPARAVAPDQLEEGGHDGGGLGPVRDVLAGERGLVHGGPHVARVDGPDGQRGELDRQHGAEMLQRGLARAVPAPALVGLDGGVRRDVQYAGVGRVEQQGERLLDEAQWCHDVDFEGDAQIAERVVGQGRQRRGTERPCVVDHEVEATEVEGGGDQVLAVLDVGDVARQGDHPHVRRGLGADPVGRGVERRPVAPVHDEPPPLPGQPSRQRLPESPGYPCHDGHAHGCPPFRAEGPLL